MSFKRVRNVLFVIACGGTLFQTGCETTIVPLLIDLISSIALSALFGTAA